MSKIATDQEPEKQAVKMQPIDLTDDQLEGVHGGLRLKGLTAGIDIDGGEVGAPGLRGTQVGSEG